MKTQQTLIRIVLAAALTVPFGLSTASIASAEPEGAVRTLLGGSFFPFARSFPKPSPRCLKAADRLRAKRDDRSLNYQDGVQLRRIGCGGAVGFP